MVGKWFENGLHMARKEFAVHLQQPEGILGLAESESEKNLLCIFRRGKLKKTEEFCIMKKVWSIGTAMRGVGHHGTHLARILTYNVYINQSLWVFFG